MTSDFLSCDDARLLFRPAAMLGHTNAEVLSRSRATLEDVGPVSELRVDCADLDDRAALALWRRSSWDDIRAGFAVFAGVRVARLVVVEPRARVRAWHLVRAIGPRLLSRKLRFRLEFHDAAGARDGAEQRTSTSWSTLQP